MLRTPARLAFNGASGRVGRLLRAVIPDAVWTSQADGWAPAKGARALICLGGVTLGDTTALRANSTAALNALDAAARLSVPRVFLLSSAAVYGRARGPLLASDAPTPAAPYGVAKAEMESAVHTWRATHPNGPEATILRLGNVLGADQLIGNMTQARPVSLHIFQDGTCPRRSYIGPATLGRVLQELAAMPNVPPVLNVAAPGTVSMADLVRAAGGTYTPHPAPDSAIATVELDVAPLAARVPFATEESQAEGMVAQWRRIVGAVA
ncbi:MAG: NAD-dependent epimerase/dehydratase family protein [Pseudomonadota bacterium]